MTPHFWVGNGPSESPESKYICTKEENTLPEYVIFTLSKHTFEAMYAETIFCHFWVVSSR